MAYCSNCGAEHDPGDSFCAECGADLDGPSEAESEPEPETELESGKSTPKATGICEKCDSEISLEAEKCPQCGYEPASHGIIGSIGVTLSLMASILIGGLILIIWVVAIGTGFTITNALMLTAFFGFFLLFPVGILFAAMKKELKTPTGEQEKSLREEIFGDE